VNPVVDRILGIDPGLEEKSGAQFGFIGRGTVMIKD
jgi:hypothetical protein